MFWWSVGRAIPQQADWAEANDTDSSLFRNDALRRAGSLSLLQRPSVYPAYSAGTQRLRDDTPDDQGFVAAVMWVVPPVICRRRHG